MHRGPGLEKRFERGLFLSRWLMAPMYMCLVISLAVMMAVMVREILKTVPRIFVMNSEDAILSALTMIDLTLAGNLLLIVIFSGYENFVSKLDIDDSVDRPAWMGTVDFSGLKMKLIGSIVAISGISLLKRFMEIGETYTSTPFEATQLKWMVITHLTFVLSGLLLAVMDWMAARVERKP